MWVYVVVGLGILFGTQYILWYLSPWLSIENTGILGTLVGLYFLHRRTREQEREKRTQYWREQVCPFPTPDVLILTLCFKNAFRQNILQMRDTAKASLLSLSPHASESNTPRSTIYNGRDHSGSVDSSIPMLRRSSGLRQTTSEEDGQDSIHGETPMTIPADYEMGGWSQRSPTTQTSRKLSKARR